jgi:hypothetical protein
MADALGQVVGFLSTNMSSGVSISTTVLNQSTDALEFICSLDTVDPITHIYVRLTSITGTSPTLRASIQGVDGSGNPDGTIKGGGSPSSMTFNPTSLGWAANSGHWLQLDNAYTPANHGEMVALVIDYSSGTIDGSNFVTFSNGFSVVLSGLPYAISNDAGSRTKASANPIFGYRTASARYGMPLKSLTTLGNFNSGSGTNEYGILFSLPSAWSDTYKIKGLQWMPTLTAAGVSTLRLYDGGAAGDTTVLQNVTMDSDHSQGTGAHSQKIYFDEATLSTLTYGNSYRLSIAPDAVNINMTYMEVEESADFGAWDYGTNFQLTQRSGGNWTDTATRRLVNFGPIVDSITEAAGGGGSMLYRGFFPGGNVHF